MGLGFLATRFQKEDGTEGGGAAEDGADDDGCDDDGSDDDGSGEFMGAVKIFRPGSCHE
jgi:hypothetical protein